MSQYASAEQFYDLSGLGRERLEQGRNPVTPDKLQTFLEAAAGLIDSAIAVKYHGSTPLQTYDATTTLRNVQIAAHFVGLRIGVGAEEAKTLKEGHDGALAWLKDIREGRVFLPGLRRIEPKTDYRGPDVGLAEEVCLGDPVCKGGRWNFWGNRG